MSDSKKPAGRRRPSKNTLTTAKGNVIKLNRSLTERYKAHRDAKARRRAAYLSSLPKNRFKRILFRLKPKELARYWFSRDGAIMALKLVGMGIVVCFVLIVGVFAYFRKDLPNIKDLSGEKLGGSITYYDRTGTIILWQDYDAVKRQPVAWDQIAQPMKDATIAIEDKDFYKHGAFDVRGIVRAGLNDALNRGGSLQGGSTISQQVVKLNQNWTADRTIGRKIKEVILAVELEREYSKQDILNGYLNIAPYGPVEYGVEIAATDYFGVSAKQLDIAQSALLAAIPKSPNKFSPYGPSYNQEALLNRQHYIIDQMVSQKMITKQQGDEAKKEDVVAQLHAREQKYNGIKAPYFVLAAKDELENTYSKETVKRGGWKVITTLNMDLQNLAEKKVSDDMPLIRKQGGDTAAFAAEDIKTGQMVALVGGHDFNNEKFGKINFAHTARVSPGSSFKPYDYSAFIDNNNAGAGSVLYDRQGPLPGWPCTNSNRPKDGGNCLWDYDFRYPDALTLRYALAGSRNVTAVKAMMSSVPNDTSPGRLASINKTISTAEAMMGASDGYACYPPGTDTFSASTEDETQCYGSSAIGDGAYLHLDDHVNGLATLARLGQQIPRTYILKITDSAGKTVAEFKQPPPKQVIKPDTAFIINSMLSDPNASYLSRKFQKYKGWDFAVKTGTTNYALDGLMASWSTQYAAVTWIGKVNDRNIDHPMKGAMEAMTTPIIRDWMQGAHDMLNTKPVGWVQPSGIQVLPAYVVHNHVGVNSVEPSPSTDLFPSWYKPPKGSNNNQTIDIVSNKLATPCTPDLAKKSQGGGSDNNFSADVFVGLMAGASADSKANDDVHQCNDDKPAITLTVPSVCHVGGNCNFTVTVTGGSHALSGGSYTDAPAGTLSFLVDGQSIDVQNIPTDSGNLWTHTFTYSPATGGQSTVQAQVVDSVLYSNSESKTITIN